MFSFPYLSPLCLLGSKKRKGPFISASVSFSSSSSSPSSSSSSSSSLLSPSSSILDAKATLTPVSEQGNHSSTSLTSLPTSPQPFLFSQSTSSQLLSSYFSILLNLAQKGERGKAVMQSSMSIS